MSLGPEKIILILVVALIVFGPQRLPEIARQVGAMMRELRRMQDTVREELENVLHPDFTPGAAEGTGQSSVEDVDHGALPPGGVAAPDMQASDMHVDENVTDDGFSGPRSFS
jgi:Tat protein translocase TatB subunit